MSVPVTSLDKCGGGVRDARVAAGADPAVQRLRHLEPQIVGTCRRAATSRGHEAAESAHLVPWTPTLSKHGERRRTKRGAVSINRELVTAAMSARHLLPAWAKTSSLVREIRHPRPRSLPVLEVALLIIGASISVAALAWPGNGVSAALLGGIVVVCPRILSAIMTSPLHHHAPRKLSATSDECPVAALIWTSFSRSSGRFAVVGSLTGPRYRLLWL